MPQSNLPAELESDIAESESENTDTKTDDLVIEVGGPKGKEPTRYGDWEKNGRCVDF